MATYEHGEPPLEAERGLMHIVYGLQALGFVTLFTWLISAVICYIKRDELKGSWLESHVNWQLKTFWIWAVCTLIGWATWWLIIGWLILGAVWLFSIYRVTKGWMRLYEGKPVA